MRQTKPSPQVVKHDGARIVQVQTTYYGGSPFIRGALGERTHRVKVNIDMERLEAEVVKAAQMVGGCLRKGCFQIIYRSEDEE